MEFGSLICERIIKVMNFVCYRASGPLSSLNVYHIPEVLFLAISFQHRKSISL